MYDSILIKYSSNNTDKILSRLTAGMEITQKKTGLIFTTGFLGNMRCKIEASNVIIQGSLPKYLLGNNYRTLSLKDTAEGIDKLESELGEDLSQADVFKLHFAENLQVKNECAQYLSALNEAKGYKILICSMGKQFIKTEKVLSFYDKKIEMKKDKSIKKSFDFDSIGNILRYELKLNSRIKNRIKCPNVRLENLKNKNFFNRILSIWKEEYFAIGKKRILVLNANFAALKTRNLFTKSIAAQGILSLGAPQVRECLKLACETGTISKLQYYRNLQSIHEILETSFIIAEEDPASELDKLINETYERNRIQ